MVKSQGGGKFPPTDEQQAAIDVFQFHEDMAVVALAGSGKTTLAEFLARSRPKTSMVYCSFNAAVAKEARTRFPSNVTSRTMHSFAFRAVGKDYSDRLEAPRVPSWRVAEILRLPDRWEFGGCVLRGKQLARLVMDAVGRFTHSASPEPTRANIPVVPGLEYPEAHAALCSLLMSYVDLAWEDLSSRRGRLRFSHDHYLKLWSLGNPRLPGEVALADECQDLDPVIASVISRQDMQKVYIGDENQQIYAWRNAVNFLEKIDVSHRLPLRRTFRFGTVIADEANLILELLQSPLRVVGHDPVDSRLAVLNRPDVVLCRTNAAAIGHLIEAQVAGLQTALAGGTRQVEALARAAQQLMDGQPTDHPELLAFSDWNQVCEYVEQDSEGAELEVLVRLIEMHGTSVLLDAARNTVPEEQADFIASTVHQAKGREWSRVKLAADFPVPLRIDPVTGERSLRVEEARLAYVAVTRAMHLLDSRSLRYLAQLSAGLGQDRSFVEVDEPLSDEVAPGVVRRTAPTEQLICDPEHRARLVFRQVRYDPELVAAQRQLPGRQFRRVYGAEENVNIVDATVSAIELAEQWGLSIAEEARARVQGV